MWYSGESFAIVITLAALLVFGAGALMIVKWVITSLIGWIRRE